MKSNYASNLSLDLSCAAPNLGEFDLSSFVPYQVKDAFAVECMPEDLVGITNANEVIAKDYFIDDQKVSSLVAIQSEEVFELRQHNCDRLDGSRLLELSNLYAKGGVFLSYELLNTQLEVSYAVSFSMYYEENKGFIVENHWNNASFPKGEEYYNFHLWSNDKDHLLDLLNATLTKVIEKDVLLRINNTDLPNLYVTHGAYEKGSLRLQIRNNEGIQDCQLSASVRRTETSGWEELNYDLSLSGEQVEVIDIPIGFLYEMGASLYSVDNTTDEIFLADGMWKIDEDQGGATLIDYRVDEQLVQLDEESYQVNRSISLQAEISSYLNVYRSFNPTFRPINLSAYNAISFETDIEGLLEVAVVKSSIEHWEDQPKIKLRLDGELKKSKIYKSDFSSIVDWRDIVMLVFTLVNEQGVSKLYEITIGDVVFEYSALSTTNDEEIETIKSKVVPNPVSSQAQIIFDGNKQADGHLRIVDIAGVEVFNCPVQIQTGIQKVEIDLSMFSSGYYYYTLIQDGGQLVSGSFIKN